MTTVRRSRLSDRIFWLGYGVLCLVGFVVALQAVIVGDVKYGALGGYGVGFISAVLLSCAVMFFWMAIRG